MNITKADNKVIDLHADTLTKCHAKGCSVADNQTMQFALDRVPAGMRWCQCMAVFIPDELRGKAAADYFDDVYAFYRRELEQNCSTLAEVQSLNGIDDALNGTPAAGILTVEGGAVLAGKLENVEKLYRRGVRMMTLTWNGANEIAGGASTDIGFTPFGRAVVGQMERLGMVVDVSHLSDRAFWELCEFATRPFVASHSNARTVCGVSRNLTDEMFGEIVRRGGLVGINYYTHFIAPAGKGATAEKLVEHILHFLALGGEDVLALGSDYDGADLPPDMDRVEKLPRLFEAMRAAKIPEKVIAKIQYKNARRFFAAVKGV